MNLYPRRREINLSDFQADKPESAKQGVPMRMSFCKKCIASYKRPNSAVKYEHTKYRMKRTINFDTEVVCDFSPMAEQKHATIDLARIRAQTHCPMQQPLRQGRRLHSVMDHKRTEDSKRETIDYDAEGAYAAWRCRSKAPSTGPNAGFSVSIPATAAAARSASTSHTGSITSTACTRC